MRCILISSGAKDSANTTTVLLVYNLEPFEQASLTHDEPSAYPPNRSLAVLPTNISFFWTKASAEGHMAGSLRLSAASSVEVGNKDEQDLKNAAPYLNYAFFGTPLETMYGEHMDLLRRTKKKHDPENVMGLAGEWKF